MGWGSGRGVRSGGGVGLGGQGGCERRIEVFVKIQFFFFFFFFFLGGGRVGGGGGQGRYNLNGEVKFL